MSETCSFGSLWCVGMLMLSSACVQSGLYADNPEITSEVTDWRDEIIYQVMIDRFANGDRNNDYNITYSDDSMARHMGGDYQGVIDKVDYLVDLGVTTVWISRSWSTSRKMPVSAATMAIGPKTFLMSIPFEISRPCAAWSMCSIRTTSRSSWTS